VVYQAGWQVGADPEADGYVALPADLVLAAKEMVRHLWLTQRGSGVQRPGSRPPDTLVATSAVPAVIDALIAQAKAALPDVTVYDGTASARTPATS
jgi:hypothetical protein